ncbi:trypsin-like peptidase domain-containing protein [Streptomyces sp. WG-D5]
MDEGKKTSGGAAPTPRGSAAPSPRGLESRDLAQAPVPPSPDGPNDRGSAPDPAAQAPQGLEVPEPAQAHLLPSPDGRNDRGSAPEPAAQAPQGLEVPVPAQAPLPPLPDGPDDRGSAPDPVAQAPQGLEVRPPEGAAGGPGAVGPWRQDEPVPAERRVSVRRRTVVIGAAVVALVAGGIGGAVGVFVDRGGVGANIELPQADPESKHRAPGSIAGIASATLPGVVTIHTDGSSEEGTGTGFVLDGRGHILTNNHVVSPAGSDGEISVTFAGGQSARAELVGHDTGYDLAVIKVDGVRGLHPLPLGNSENVQVGDSVVAIGAPFDLANTVTAGIISAKDRPITAGGEKGDGSDISYVDALQTDAPINPGNSGGPLLDAKARVIGINSAIRSAGSGGPELTEGQSGSIGLGFAIPVNQAKRVAEELINTGRATHPVIGVTLDMDYSGDGARVGTKGNSGGSAVSPGGPGAKAGIEPGDVITEVDGVRVHSGEELIVKIRTHRPQDELVLTLERDGKERKMSLVLGAADGD